MLSYYNIKTIAKYERRILLRSWFFRIFAILSLFVIGMFGGTTLFNQNPFTWMFRSLPSALIYSNMFLLNIFQSIIAVFLATEFLKRDKKMNTSEVLFIRPMTNTEYVVGKTWGLLNVFIILNVLVILLSSIFMLISDQVAFRIVPILLYFVLVSIPTLVFVIGLSYTLMIIIKNQPISFIILLGYIALILFYLGDKLNYMFDYMVFVKPMPYSDIIGFSNWNDVLFHRLSYLLLGIGLIMFTAWRLNRLPNTNRSNLFLGVLTVLIITISAFGFVNLWQHNANVNNNRLAYSNLSAMYFDYPVPDMMKASIEVEYGTQLKASSKMVLVNNTSQSIDTLYFSLNPGFEVEKVLHDYTEIKFIQDQLLIKVIPTKPMGERDKWNITMFYSGKPYFDMAYLDNEDENVFGYNRVMTLRIDRQYGFYSSDFVLLTKENIWYPVPGVVYDPTRPAIFRQQFTKFDLTVNSKPGMLPISQGKRTTDDSLNFHFKVRDLLPQLSLTIGKYKEERIDVSGIDVGIAYIEGHDYFKKNLSELGDTISDLMVEFLDDYERPLGLFYPYPKFSLVEVPVQFASQTHSWTSTLAQSQPQMVFFPEWGFNVRQADFKSSAKRIKRNSDRNKQGLTDKEIQAQVFTNFLKGVFAEEAADMRFGPQSGSNQSNPYNIFPNYFYYVNYIASDECPVLNYAFESYLMKGEDDPRSMFMSRMTGIGDDEKANILLKDKSLKQIIAEEEDQQAINRVLSAKGAYLLTWMEKQINDENFKQFLLDYLYDNSYKEIKYGDLIKAVSQKFNIEMGNFLADWYNANRLPAFGMGAVETFETIAESQAVFVVKTKITNYTDVAGLVKLTFQSGGGGRGGFFGGGSDQSDPEERIYLLEGNQTKEIQIVLYESPRSLIFNTLLSQNIPSKSMENGLRAEKEDDMKAVEYEKVIDQPVDLIGVGELIVDNRDSGFSTNDPALANPLRQFVEKRKKADESEFVGEGFGQAPSTWGLNANSDYFGKIEHSAMIVRSGDGTKVATWKKQLSEAGYYDVYAYLNRQRGSRGRGRGRNRSEAVGKYIYTIHHDDGVEKIELETKEFEDGWNLLGSFYLSSDTAIVTLSDEGGASKVVADAMKWTLQR